MRKPDHFTRAELRAAIRAQNVTKRDRALLTAVASLDAIEFTYEPRGKHAYLVESPRGMDTGTRRRLHALAKRGLVSERLHGCSKTVNDPPQHTWKFVLTAAGREAIS